MTTTLRAVREGVQGKLAAINGTSGGYALLDLDGTDAVKVGHWTQPWLTTGHMACLWLLQDKRNAGPTLCGKSQVATFGLLIWAPVTSDDPEVREDAIEDIWADLTKRFRAQTDRTLGGISIETELALDDHVGTDALSGSDRIIVACTVTCTFREALP